MPEQGRALHYKEKKQVIWDLEDVRGGQNRKFTCTFTYDTDDFIDEKKIKHIGPFQCNFEIPNHTASGAKIKAVDVATISAFGQ